MPVPTVANYGRVVVLKRTGQDSASFDLIDSSYLFGRIQLATISEEHCRVFRNTDGKAIVENISVQGIVVNGTTLGKNESHILNNGDILTIVERSFRFECDSPIPENVAEGGKTKPIQFDSTPTIVDSLEKASETTKEEPCTPNKVTSPRAITPKKIETPISTTPKKPNSQESIGPVTPIKVQSPRSMTPSRTQAPKPSSPGKFGRSPLKKASTPAKTTGESPLKAPRSNGIAGSPVRAMKLTGSPMRLLTPTKTEDTIETINRSKLELAKTSAQKIASPRKMFAMVPTHNSMGSDDDSTRIVAPPESGATTITSTFETIATPIKQIESIESAARDSIVWLGESEISKALSSPQTSNIVKSTPPRLVTNPNIDLLFPPTPALAITGRSTNAIGVESLRSSPSMHTPRSTRFSVTSVGSPVVVDKEIVGSPKLGKVDFYEIPEDNLTEQVFVDGWEEPQIEAGKEIGVPELSMDKDSEVLEEEAMDEMKGIAQSNNGKEEYIPEVDTVDVIKVTEEYVPVIEDTTQTIRATAEPNLLAGQSEQLMPQVNESSNQTETMETLKMGTNKEIPAHTNMETITTGKVMAKDDEAEEPSAGINQIPEVKLIEFESASEIVTTQTERVMSEEVVTPSTPRRSSRLAGSHSTKTPASSKSAVVVGKSTSKRMTSTKPKLALAEESQGNENVIRELENDSDIIDERATARRGRTPRTKTPAPNNIKIHEAISIVATSTRLSTGKTLTVAPSTNIEVMKKEESEADGTSPSLHSRAARSRKRGTNDLENANPSINENSSPRTIGESKMLTRKTPAKKFMEDVASEIDDGRRRSTRARTPAKTH